MRRVPIAIQVYSVRQEAEADFAGTMKKIKEMGYDGVELAGLYGKSVQEIRSCLTEVGLTAISAHVPYEEFVKNPEKTAASYAEIGCRYVAIPWLSEERRYGKSKYEETLAAIPRIAEACRKQGMQLLYHNHDFEFQKAADGRYHLDLLYGAIAAADLATELDTCWVKVGGEDPAAYLDHYRNRCPLVHIKDFQIRDDKVELVALGEGEQKLEELVKSAVRNGAQWLVIEQDDHPYGTPMGNMEKSLACLKKLLA